MGGGRGGGTLSIPLKEQAEVRHVHGAVHKERKQPSRPPAAGTSLDVKALGKGASYHFEEECRVQSSYQLGQAVGSNPFDWTLLDLSG